LTERPHLDTVETATATPDRDQPWADLGLKPDEYAEVREILGRRPTSSELAMYSVMWSEHCSYKSSKVHLRQFGDNVTDEMREHLMVGIGENAGVVDIGDGWAVTFKVESHNHPSYVEPYQGAATGVGGIVRDILAMGARPVAVMDPLRFGPLDAPDTLRVLPGIVAGVGGYGNCLGLPNIGGEAVFDASYAGNPLVNALCIGVMRHEQLHLAKASGAGNQVVLYGARTGGDGIGGVSVLASETFESTGPAKRPSVQVGDPFQEKLLIECTLEIFAEVRDPRVLRALGPAGVRGMILQRGKQGAATKIPAISQKRMTTVISSHPSISKWWCRGAIRKSRLPLVALKNPTWRITDRVWITNSPPSRASSTSVRVRMANPASAPPSASEPVSPMKIFAGEAFHHRKPKHAPVIAAATTARSNGSRTS